MPSSQLCASYEGTRRDVCAQTGLYRFIYVLVATSVRFAGTKWIDKLLPPIIIGPMIIVAGLGLAGSAVTNAGLVADGNWKNALVAVVTFLIVAFINTKGKGFLRIIPFLFAIIGGYLFALTLGLVDFTPVLKANWLKFLVSTCHLAQNWCL